MPQKISSTPVRQTSKPKPAGPGKLEVGQVLLPLFQTALNAKNGFTPRFAPTADQLKQTFMATEAAACRAFKEQYPL